MQRYVAVFPAAAAIAVVIVAVVIVLAVVVVVDIAVAVYCCCSCRSFCCPADPLKQNTFIVNIYKQYSTLYSLLHYWTSVIVPFSCLKLFIVVSVVFCYCSSR